MKPSFPRSGGPRSEVSILLPSAMMLLVVLSSIALFSYRATLDQLLEERRLEAENLARRLAVEVAQEGWTTSDLLKQRVPGADQVAILDATGWPVIGDAELTPEGLGVAGEAPFQVAGRSYRMRVDLPAGLLLSRQRSVELATPWILLLEAGILFVVFLSMRRLLVPIDEMLEKARRFTARKGEPQSTPAADEVGFLSSTFDRAVDEIEDLTAAYRRSREEKLAESLRQLGELAAGAAHEMRNSIATLKGYVALIDRDPGQRHLEENLAEIRRESEHLHRVLEDFLSFARPGNVRLGTVDLRQTLVRALADPALGVQPYKLEVEPAASFAVVGDALLLERALRNLLSNAVAAQERAGRGEASLGVRLFRSGANVELELEDHGGGIPTELMPRLFEPFAAGHPKGVGLGLALTRRIVVLHGGELAIASQEGLGVTARVSLPAAPSVAPS